MYVLQDLDLWVWVSRPRSQGLGFRIKISRFEFPDLGLRIWIQEIGSKELDLCISVSGFISLH